MFASRAAATSVRYLPGCVRAKMESVGTQLPPRYGTWLAAGVHNKWGSWGANWVITRKRLRPAAYKCLISMVAGPRIELGTRGFSVRCSTG